MIGKITRVRLRQVWQHEASEFTRWLEDNIDVLNETLDLNLVNPEREKDAGAFSVDLVAEDDKGNPVIIENQLEKSNHDHLGKLITYLTAMEARAAIWIVSEPRPEHVKAVAWLNESSSASFYLVKLEAIQIGDSPHAPLLTLIVGPSEEAAAVGKTKKDMAERYVIRHRFWTCLLERSKRKTKLHAGISPTEHNSLATGAGLSGLGYNYALTKHTAYVELYIDRGKDSDEENKAILDQLAAHKGQVEQVFGGALEWQSLEGKRACRIRKVIETGGYRDDEEKWPKIQEDMIDAMIALEEALKPHVANLRIGA